MNHFVRFLWALIIKTSHFNNISNVYKLLT